MNRQVLQDVDNKELGKQKILLGSNTCERQRETAELHGRPLKL